MILDRDVYRTYGGAGRLNDIPFIKNGVPAFMPNTPVEIGLGVSHSYLGQEVDREKHPARFEITAVYEFERRTLRETSPHRGARPLCRNADQPNGNERAC